MWLGINTLAKNFTPNFSLSRNNSVFIQVLKPAWLLHSHYLSKTIKIGV
nr:MAG TPA: hypothetical protein [Caudoviricetes sp.]